MIVYPVLAKLLGLDETAAGVLFGATIHDVAQVLGAGLTVSPHAGDVATFVKLVRVACLLPVVVGIGLVYRTSAAGKGAQSQPLLPHFLIGFIALVVLGSVVPLPAALVSGVSEVSRWCLLVAISALGVKSPAQIGPDLSNAVEDVQSRFGVTIDQFLANPTGTMSVVLTRQIVLTPEQKQIAIQKLRDAFAEYQRQRGQAASAGGK